MIPNTTEQNSIEEMAQKITDLENELNEIKVSRAYRLALRIRNLRRVLLPRNSKMEQFVRLLWNIARGRYRSKSHFSKRNEVSLPRLNNSVFSNKLIQLAVHKDPIDIIICIHNALIDIQKCLSSVEKNTNSPYSITIVNDGSNELTTQFVNEFCDNNPNVKLISNNQALGYTRAANMGLRASTAPYIVLLNSDTIVTRDWLDRMMRVMKSDDSIGLVGPLSNTASWQSIPKLLNSGDWASNNLPVGTDAETMARNVAEFSGLIWPEVPLINGFCMLIKKEVIDQIGFFDEENFGQGYGEEDDFVIRATSNGWKVKIADDAYVYHAQSKSYSNSTRKKLSAINGEKLRKKHGFEAIEDRVDFMASNRVFEGIRNRSEKMFERKRILNDGQRLFTGKSVLFVLPITDAGGGGNVVINESIKMRKMGVNVSIFNLIEYKPSFTQSYPSLDIPFIYGSTKDLIRIGMGYDAIVATASYSVEWLRPFVNKGKKIFYYVQGFEPLMFIPGSKEYEDALNSYTAIKEMNCFTKTEWTRNTLLKNTGVDCKNIGISIDIDLFRPFLMRDLGKKPVTIAAMVRPHSPYRSPLKTVSILQKIKKAYGNKVNICFFGANDISDVIAKEHLDFEWTQFGKINQSQVAMLFSNVDIFVDFSSHQAMGLSALEAMACGSAVIVPQFGGAIEFVTDGVNGLVVDTSSETECVSSVKKLIEDDEFRKKLQIQAMHDVCDYYPERAAYNILDFFFNEK